MAKRATLQDLLGAGLLKVGDELVCEPCQGEVYKATLQADGSIFSNGIGFGSPSNWAKYVAQNERNGWKTVKAMGRPLAEFRAQLGNRMVTRKRPTVTNAAVPPPVEVPIADLGESSKGSDQRLLSRLQSLTPTQFEHLVGKFLKAKGITEVQVTGHSSDGGIDATGNIPFVNVKIAVQAKRYASDNAVGAPQIRNFKGGLIGRYDRGIFITTSTFTAGAKEEAEQPGITLVLIDGNDLVRQMTELGLGMKTIPVVETHIDEDFFKNLGV